MQWFFAVPTICPGRKLTRRRCLLSPEGQRQIALHSGLIPLDPEACDLVPGLGDLFGGQRRLIPIRFGPGLMAHLDHFEQDMFSEDVSPDAEALTKRLSAPGEWVPVFRPETRAVGWTRLD